MTIVIRKVENTRLTCRMGTPEDPGNCS